MAEAAANPHADQRNIPDYAAEELARLEREHTGITADVTAILEEARALPATVEDEETSRQFTAVITRIDELNKRINGIRESEKDPHLRRERAVDGFFFGLMEKLRKRNRNDRAGARDVLHARVHEYNVKREEEERKKREEAERAAAEQERIQREAREKAEREAREAEERAARARKPENKEAATQEAAAAKEKAYQLRDQEERARATRQDAAAAANAKPGELVRERHSGAGMNTMRQVPYADVIDSSKLDPVKLWPFVPEDAKARALKGWAQVTQHQEPMEGAAIGFRNDTVIRR